MRILIVEDETSIANFIRDGLEEEGYAVDVADNGKQGLQLALDYIEEYDVILLDWMLPGLNGIEICRNIRKTKQDSSGDFSDSKGYCGRCSFWFGSRSG